MGTRADFYVGKGPNAEWLGSIAWDGYPDGNPADVLEKITEHDYRAAVELVLSNEHCGPTRPEQGWPWPWEDSRTTDFAYTFDLQRVLISCFGRPWVGSEDEMTDEYFDSERTGPAAWPQMDTGGSAVPGSNRSGIMAIGLRGDS